MGCKDIGCLWGPISHPCCHISDSSCGFGGQFCDSFNSLHCNNILPEVYTVFFAVCSATSLKLWTPVGVYLACTHATAIHCMIEMMIPLGSGNPESAHKIYKQMAQTPMPPDWVTPMPCPWLTPMVSWVRKALCYYQISGRKKSWVWFMDQ